MKTPRKNLQEPSIKRIVLDGGYDVPGGYTGRVVTGMGPGPNRPDSGVCGFNIIN